MERLKSQNVEPPEVAGECLSIVAFRKNKQKNSRTILAGSTLENLKLLICSSGRKCSARGPRRGRQPSTSSATGAPTGASGRPTASSGYASTTATGRTVKWSPGPARSPSDAPGSAAGPSAGCTGPAQPALTRLAHNNSPPIETFAALSTSVCWGAARPRHLTSLTPRDVVDPEERQDGERPRWKTFSVFGFHQ